MTRRQEKVSGVIREFAATYLESVSNHSPMITVTRTNISPDLKKGTIYLSVFPESEEEKVLRFVKGKRTGFRNFLKSKSSLKRIPFFDFKIDEGEKNRQRIDEISLNS